MAESLGEKLRLAREARGITISEVSAQTRIATRYLEAIEENNYKPLPGGVFNKGFIKAYAKYVGVDETEALNDYARIVATSAPVDDDPHYKRNSVMIDDRRSSSWTSIFFAVIILALLCGGIYALVQWYRSAPAEVKTPPANSNANANRAAAANTEPTPAPVDQIKVEIRSINGVAPFVTTSVDAEKPFDKAVTADAPRILNPREMVKISYSRSQGANLQLFVNGKQITLPQQPLKPTDSTIKFDINKSNIAQILQSGQITLGDTAPVLPAAPVTDANVDANTATPPTAAASTPASSRPTLKPAATPAKTPAAANTNSAAPKPTARPVVQPTVIVPGGTPKKPGE
jgi:cytoskeletal protein RodZ